MNLTINGSAVKLDDRHAKTPLLWVLRDVLGTQARNSAAESATAQPNFASASQATCSRPNRMQRRI